MYNLFRYDKKFISKHLGHFFLLLKKDRFINSFILYDIYQPNLSRKMQFDNILIFFNINAYPRRVILEILN